ncbi:MAG: chemotaxis protein CheA, partial [Lachnospiraceae bacterium]|nr:chemotaxis protein CheA [Lachnospiraceae bacterium]
MDVSQYLEIFIEETKEHLQVMNDQILILEKEPDNPDCINEIFRAAHSLKGMAGTMGFKAMQHLTHTMEDVFSEVRNGKIKVTAEMIDILFQGMDELQLFLDNVVNTSDEGTPSNEKLPDILSGFITAAESGEAPAPAAEPKKEAKAPAKGKKGSKKAAAAAAEAEAEATETEKEADNAPKYKELKFAEHELKAIEKAGEMGKNVFGATVHIAESCVLKGPRAFLVFKNLEPLGDVIKSSPDAQDIEDDKFDFEFSVCIVTAESMDKIKEAILNVSEIESVEIGELKVEKSEEAGEETKKEEAGTPAKAAAPAAGDGQAKAAQKPQTASKPVVSRSVRVDIEKLDNLMNSVSELIIAKNGLVSISATESNLSNQQGFNEQMEYLERITTEIHQSVMKVRMVPIESVVNKFPRMIRDLSKKLDKKMELYMTGEDTELDRTVVDEIGDPLQHLLRNSADHGLEKNEDRIAAGKEEVGSIFLNAYQEGNNVVIEVRDDGAGINFDKVKKKA